MIRLSFDVAMSHHYPVCTIIVVQSLSRARFVCDLRCNGGFYAARSISPAPWDGHRLAVRQPRVARHARPGPCGHRGTFTLASTVQEHDTIWRVRVTPDGARFVAYTAAGITVRRMSDNAIVWNNPVNGYFAISPDGDLLVTAGADSSDLHIRVWRMRDGHHLRTITLPDTNIE